MHTLIVIIETAQAEELLKYHHIFWAVTFILYTDYQQEFLAAVKVLEALFTKLDFNDEGIFVHFAKNRPPNPEIPFVGIQPLLIKGLTSDFTYDASIKLLKHIALLPPENELVEVNQSMPHRYLTSLLGLAPWLMANFEKEESNKLALDLAQMFQKAQLDEFSEHFTNYTKSAFKAETEFGKSLGSLIAKRFFPEKEIYSFSLLVEFLDIGPEMYKRYILDLMVGMNTATNWENSALAKEEAPALFAVVGKQFNSEQWSKAVGVMNVVLSKSPTVVDIGRAEHINVLERIIEFERASRTWQSADKSKALLSKALLQVVQRLPSAAEQPTTEQPSADKE